ncbi:ribbon-helix-helix protein, CopG family [Lacisediminihabitans sp. FW035]
MATNLRLRPDAETALRAEAARSNRSQQDLIRDALDQYLGLAAGAGGGRSVGALDGLVAAGGVKPARGPIRYASRLLELPEGVTSLDLLDREDRL